MQLNKKVVENNQRDNESHSLVSWDAKKKTMVVCVIIVAAIMLSICSVRVLVQRWVSKRHTAK